MAPASSSSSRRIPWQGAGYGLLTFLPALALLQLWSTAVGRQSPAYAVFEWLTRVLPGAAVTLGIDTLVSLLTALALGPLSDVAKRAEQLFALTLFSTAGAIVGFVLGTMTSRAAAWLGRAGALAGALVWLVSIAAQASRGLGALGVAGALVWGLVFVGWGALLGLIVRTAQSTPATGTREARSRRHALRAVAGSALTLFAIAAGLSRWLRMSRRPAQAALPEPQALMPKTSGPAASPSARDLEARPAAAPGVRSEITPNDRFYRIDINLMPPRIDADTWRLRVTGRIARALELTLADLRARPSVSQFITLQCISNRVGGELTGTALFTGVRLRDVLAEAGGMSPKQHMYVEAADGFHESLAAADVADPRTLLVYAMNGVPLPVEHGFPLRVYIPNRYGMKQPKWITRLEVTDEERPGYWVTRGWSRTAFVKTTSVIDNVGTGMRMGKRTFMPVGGIAYAGARGISRVEVQVDDGPWVEASLRAPALGPLTWVQWRLDWPYEPGRHTFRVRAYDGRGQLQHVEEHGPRPDGASGVHTIMTTV